jgi:nitrite reductase/ring-hydroxylating ferredoxin subunit
VEIGSMEEFGSEERVLLQAGDREILLLQHAGSIFAIENVCSLSLSF